MRVANTAGKEAASNLSLASFPTPRFYASDFFGELHSFAPDLLIFDPAERL
jgi:hypothetical protein